VLTHCGISYIGELSEGRGKKSRVKRRGGEEVGSCKKRDPMLDKRSKDGRPGG